MHSRFSSSDRNASTHPLALWVSLCAYLLSGVAALVYQVLWFKRLSVIWGNSTLASGAVTAAFMLGLCLGAWLGGRIASRFSNQLILYGVLEVCIGIAALAIPIGLDCASFIAAHTYDSLAKQSGLHTLVRSLSTFAVLGPSCILMGATLPLMTEWFVAAHRYADDRAAGILYGVNTLGAAAGVSLAGFFLLPTFGLGTTNFFAAALNVLIGLISIWAGRLSNKALNGLVGSELVSGAAYLEESDNLRNAQQYRTAEFKASPLPCEDRQVVNPIVPTVSFGAVYTAAFLSGYAALNWEMVWIRELLLVLGGSTYAFSSIITVILLGIATGSLGYSAIASTLRQSAWAAFIVIAASIVCAYLGQIALPELAEAAGALRSFRNTTFGNAAVCLAVSSVLVLFPALCMGALLPMLVASSAASGLSVGKRLGVIYAWNTLGCILGATVSTGFLIPSQGTWFTFLISVGAYAGVALILEREYRRAVGVARLCCPIVGFAVLLCISNPVPVAPINLGQYLYGPIPSTSPAVVFFDEGISSNILVTRSGQELSLRVNGKVDASNGFVDMQTQLAVAYFPRILKPRAKDVLVVGFGSGTSAGASLLFPDTHVTCCELEPAVLEASSYFSSFNHRPFDSARFKVVSDDARSYLRGTRSPFDIIISEPSNPWMDGVAALFTVEHFQACKQRLRSGGIYVQWVQTYSLAPDDYQLIVRSVSHVFRNCAVMLINDGDTLILASDDRFDVDPKTLDAAQSLFDSVPTVRDELRKYFTTSDLRAILLKHYLLGQEEVDGISQRGAGLNTDYNMRLAFDAPARLFQDSPRSLVTHLLNEVKVAEVKRRFLDWGCQKQHLQSLRQVYRQLRASNCEERAAEVLDFAISVNPGDRGLRLESQLHSILATNDVDRKAIASLISISAVEANQLGVSLWRLGRHRLAIRVFEEIVLHHPQSVTAWDNLATNYTADKQHEKASLARRTVARLDKCRSESGDSTQEPSER